MHAAEAAGQDDHVGRSQLQILHAAVGLHAHAVTGLDQRPADPCELHFHAAAAQNVARRNGFHRLKPVPKIIYTIISCFLQTFFTYEYSSS